MNVNTKYVQNEKPISNGSVFIHWSRLSPDGIDQWGLNKNCIWFRILRG